MVNLVGEVGYSGNVVYENISKNRAGMELPPHLW
jgi:hypothetical protein